MIVYGKKSKYEKQTFRKIYVYYIRRNMDRILDIENNKRKENIEVNTFMKELENALKTNNIANSKGVYTTLYDEVLNEIDLATKYKGKLNNIQKSG